MVSHLHSGGISTPTSSIVLKNLKIGYTYSVQRLTGKSFTVNYNGNKMVDLKILIQKPVQASGEYEPIPDTNWIKLIKENFEPDQGQSCQTDILITIPDDKKYLGKKYFVNIYPQALPAGKSSGGLVFGLGLLCRLKFEISPELPTIQDIEIYKKMKVDKTLNVKVSPERIFLKKFQTNRKVNIKKEYGHSLKIENLSEFEIKAVVRSVKPEAVGITPPLPFVSTENPLLLIAGRGLLTKNFGRTRTIKIKPGKTKDISLYIKLPEDSKNKNIYFLLETEISSEIGTEKHYTKIYIETM